MATTKAEYSPPQGLENSQVRADRRRKAAVPQCHGFVDGTIEIVEARGIQGIYRGLLSVELSAAATFGIGGIAGLVAGFITMPSGHVIHAFFVFRPPTFIVLSRPACGH
ncbi:hypothetical protein BJ322DRAFT_1102565 [Thelephora terrestris]|uniref:Uncharacterized protein n=1 Tax=Thelephora terrestris TaxID=56493 RepID=A0A9P6HNT6_9AGAM|nr:hypothetical protein BJ322DRAFT_1102565 [Thelephora terrestris]